MSSVTEVLVDSSCIRKRLVLEDTRGTEVIDPVHGRFHLGPICSLAEGTAALQRLRNLKQLGPTCYGPYPAAVHTRHEHSLGVAHLARLCLVHLAAAGAEDDVRQADVELTALAGLCHDLGHGPFSHSFDTFLDNLFGQHNHTWHHESMSCQLLEHVLSEAQLDLDSQQVAHVQDLIDNSAHRHLRQALQPEQAWRLQVVSNSVNGLDMDKVDYLVRDSLISGVQLQQDYCQFVPLVTHHNKVLSGQICYDQVQQQHVAAVYDARAALHSRVYQHPDSKAAELMIADALAVAEPLLQMQHQIQDPEEFLTLDDTIVNHIKAAARCKGAHSCVKQATQILQRLQRHDTFYQLAAEAELPAQPVEQHNNGSSSSDGGSGSSSRLSVDDLVRCQDQGGVAGVVLRARDLRLQHYNINYCFQDEDPLDRVYLYDAASCTISQTASTGLERSGMQFLSDRVRVYIAKHCTSSADLQAYAAAAQAALCEALKMRYGRCSYKLLHTTTTRSSSSSSSNRKGRHSGVEAVDVRGQAAVLLQQRPSWDRFFLSSCTNGGVSACSREGAGEVARVLGDARKLSAGAAAAAAAAAPAVPAPAGDEVAYGSGVVQCWSDS